MIVEGTELQDEHYFLERKLRHKGRGSQEGVAQGAEDASRPAGRAARGAAIP